MPKNEPEEECQEDKRTLLVTESARFLGISRAGFQRLIQRGLIKGKKNEKGHQEFSFLDLQELKDSGAWEDDKGNVISEAMTELVQLSLEHSRKGFDQWHSPSLKILELLQKDNERLQNRCQKLEENNLELVKAREEMLNDLEARRIAGLEAEASIKRKDQIVDTFKSGFKPLVEQFIAGKQAESLLSKLLRTMNPAKLKILRDFSEGEERILVDALFKTYGVKLDDTPEDLGDNETEPSQPNDDQTPVTETSGESVPEPSSD